MMVEVLPVVTIILLGEIIEYNTACRDPLNFGAVSTIAGVD